MGASWGREAVNIAVLGFEDACLMTVPALVLLWWRRQGWRRPAARVLAVLCFPWSAVLLWLSRRADTRPAPRRWPHVVALGVLLPLLVSDGADLVTAVRRASWSPGSASAFPGYVGPPAYVATAALVFGWFLVLGAGLAGLATIPGRPAARRWLQAGAPLVVALAVMDAAHGLWAIAADDADAYERPGVAGAIVATLSTLLTIAAFAWLARQARGMPRAASSGQGAQPQVA